MEKKCRRHSAKLKSKIYLSALHAPLQHKFNFFGGVALKGLNTQLLTCLLTSDEFPLNSKSSIRNLLAAVITDFFSPNSFFPFIKEKVLFLKIFEDFCSTNLEWKLSNFFAKGLC